MFPTPIHFILKQSLTIFIGISEINLSIFRMICSEIPSYYNKFINFSFKHQIA